MKAADPAIKIFVFDECTFYKEAYEALCGGRLDITGKDKAGNWIIDGFTFHNYPNGRDFNRDDVVFKGPYNIRSQVIQLKEMMEECKPKTWPYRRCRFTLGAYRGECNLYQSGQGDCRHWQSFFLGGQFIAEIYGIGLEYGAFTVNPWCLSETDRVSTDFGFLGLPFRILSPFKLLPYAAYGIAHEGNFLPSASS